MRFYAAIRFDNHPFDLRRHVFADTSAVRNNLPHGITPEAIAAASAGNPEGGPAWEYYLSPGTRSPRLGVDQVVEAATPGSSYSSETNGISQLASCYKVPVSLTDLPDTGTPPDWPERSEEQQSVWIDVSRDVVFLSNGACWLGPFSPGKALSVQFWKLPQWFFRIQKLALRLPDRVKSKKPGTPWVYDYLLCQFGSAKLKWKMPDLRTLHLVGYRDPECPYGPPCTWDNFIPALLDEDNFLPVADFIKLHQEKDQEKENQNPDLPVGCRCRMSEDAAYSFVNTVRKRPIARNGNLDIRVVADPY